jgi:predicted ArsR family transcriptional regulator
MVGSDFAVPNPSGPNAAGPNPEAQDIDTSLTALAALGEPLRRALYQFVAGQDHAVSRDEAAEGLGVARSAAAFHLDRLVEDGLVETEYRRLSGRQGPGAGRPAKLYRRARGEIQVSLPPRRYAFAAGLLADAVTESAQTGAPVASVLDEVARRRGAELAAAAGDRRPIDVLAAEGYEPHVRCGDVVLANCPFHVLAAEHPALVCGMNLALLGGFVGALPETGLEARLEPSEGHCCVRLGAAKEDKA